MIGVMKWQGSYLITPASPNGILDVEFAKSSERFSHLQLFLDTGQLRTNLYLDFIFIAAYTWFLFAASNYFAETKGQRAGVFFSSVALSAGMFDVLENVLLLMILNGRFSPSISLIIYYIALLKFMLVAAVILYLLVAALLVFRKTKTG